MKTKIATVDFNAPVTVLFTENHFEDVLAVKTTEGEAALFNLKDVMQNAVMLHHMGMLDVLNSSLVDVELKVFPVEEIIKDLQDTIDGSDVAMKMKDMMLAEVVALFANLAVEKFLEDEFAQ